MGVGFSDDMRAQLEAAATKAGHSIAEEIRQRLETTIKEEQRDQKLRDLLYDIDFLADLVSNDSGLDWHVHPAAHAIFRAGVLALLDQRRPKGAPVLSPAVRDLFGQGISDSDDPDTIGRALVRHLNRVKQYRAKELQQRPKGENDGT
jgi:hypothetical protein